MGRETLNKAIKGLYEAKITLNRKLSIFIPIH